MKGIILAGGSGSRLYPATYAISKQLIPIYDKPMVYYPLSILMLAGIRDILLISTPEDTPRFQKIFNNGSKWGLKIQYAVQEHPNGLAEAFIIGEKFISGKPCALILGDNVFFGNELTKQLKEAVKIKEGATIFAYKVNQPERYGVVEFNKKTGKVISLIEKPKVPKSRYAITGLYFYDHHVVEYAKTLEASKRGELEITDLNNIYLKKGLLEVKVMSRGMAWLDTGTFDSLMDASIFIETIQRRQGLKIACLEEIAFRKGYISKEDVLKIAKEMYQNSYGQYLIDLMDEYHDDK